MPRERNPAQDKAKEIWLKSNGQKLLKDIAAELKIPENRVRKWKSINKWEQELKGNAPIETNGSVPIPKRSAPKKGPPQGNQNAKGNSGGAAPPGNKNNYKHGLHEQLKNISLSPEVRRMIEAMDCNDEEFLLVHQIVLCTAREQKILERIAEAESTKGGLALDSVISRKLEIKGSVVKDDKQRQTETTTRTISTFEVIQKLEAELTRVQGRKTRCIEALNKLRMQKRNLNEEARGNNQDRAPIQNENKIIVYLPDNRRDVSEDSN